MTGIERATRQWNDLSDKARIAIIAAGVIEVTLLLVAQARLVRLEKEQVRGKKWVWFLANFVNFLGPVSFLLFGHRRSSDA